MIEDWQHGGFGLYVHWPFCEAKCPYCDFNSYVSQNIDQVRWTKAYAKELERLAEHTSGRILNSIFFGGGTPSLMDASVVEAIVRAAEMHWVFANDIEITLEANPSSVEAEKFQAFRHAGVNRVSLGVQSLRDDDLKALGRLHSVSEARAAIDIAQTTFDRVSFDLIYARQNQSLNEWNTELNEALALGTDHLSLYQLTIEQGTAFGDRFNRGLLRGLPSEDLSADMFFLTQHVCEDAGLPAYETSNHARVGQESRHNKIYWTAGDFLGVGPGAHGRITNSQGRFATEAHLAPGAWLNAVEIDGSGESGRILLNDEEADEEYLLMGLRLHDGIDLTRLNKQDKYIKINDLVEIGLVACENETLKLTEAGRPLLNSILKELV